MKSNLIRLTLGSVVALWFGWQTIQFSNAQDQNALPDLGIAPELHEGIWLNTDTPLKLEALRGKVVLLEMWTFGCYNCVNTLPNVIDWWDTYQDDGLVIIGNHMPEFDFEADLENLRQALVDYGITYPVLQDNQRLTWDAYRNRYWPTMYLIDKQGHLRYKHIGEGAYALTENNIQALLAEPFEAFEVTTEAPAVITTLSPTQEVSVRAGAGTDFAVIGRILPNEAYYVLEQQEGWLRINFDQQDAWVTTESVQTR